MQASITLQQRSKLPLARDEYMKAFNWVCQGNAGIGVLVRENLADIKLLALYAAASIIFPWEQYQEILYCLREERGYKYFEN